MMEEQIKYYENKLRFETDPADLAAMFQNETVDERIVVIDTRSTGAFEKEHIPGAVSIPHRNMDRESMQSLDRGALYVTYCDGIGCNASTQGALKLVRSGFRVKELQGGIDWWKRDGYSTEGTEGKQGSFHVHCAC